MSMEESFDLAVAAQEDVGNILHLEHVNLRVADQRTATIFYLEGMGFTRDPHFVVGVENMWVNVGDTQFHLPVRTPQVLRGEIGIVLPDLDAQAGRLQAVGGALAGTRFAWARNDEGIDVSCPWGNRFHCMAPSPRHPGIGLGIAYVAFDVPVGSAAGIARFYEQVFDAPVRLEEQGGRATTCVMVASQELRFRETAEPPAPYDGHHIAIYVARLSKGMAWLLERNLLTEGLLRHQYRFQAIVDPADGRTLFEIEHEVRSMRHPMFLRPLINRDAAHSARSYGGLQRPSPQPRWGP